MTRYAIQAYHVNPNSNRVCTQSDSGTFPESKPDYYFYNIGMTEIYAEAIYGTAFSWIGPIAGLTIHPGGGSVVSTGGRAYYFTGQKVYNHGNRRAIVHCSTVNGYNSFESGDPIPFKIDINGLAQTLVAFGVGKIPYVGGILSTLTKFFWPTNKVSVWDQIKDKVNNLLDQKMKETIQSILGGDLRYMQERITVFNLELDDPKASNLNQHYLNIALDLIGFEKKFSVRAQDNSNYKNINYFLLPMYTAVVNLKVLFYQFGIVNKEKIKLTDDNIYNIKNYLSRLIEEKEDGAIAYINSVFQDQYNLEYDTCYVDTIYNSLAIVRQYCGINGLEYFEYWRAIVQNPMIQKKPHINTITYSTIFSRPTPILSRQMIDDVPVPLQPKMVDGERNKMAKLEGWIFRMGGGAPKIQGMKIYYENGDTHEMGKRGSETHLVDLKGAYIKKMTVWGNGALDMLEMNLSDGRYESIGSNADSRGVHEVFELNFHHIAGMFLANDATALGGQSAGIGVSYQLTPES